MRSPAQQAVIREMRATNGAATARREADRAARCTGSWWLEPDQFYARAKQEAGRMNQQTTVLQAEGCGAMSDWQLIETAPKDGRQVLVWRDSGVHLMRWQAVNGHADGGFWDEWHAKLRHLTIQPTHWMPLPEPPQQTTNYQPKESA